MPDFKKIISQENQLLSRKDSLAILIDLIDDQFIEIGSSGTIYNKDEVVRWLESEDRSERAGGQFKALRVSEDVILLTYVSSIKENHFATNKLALRSSIWRKIGEDWRLIFHQGTPFN